jgi:hypothetical protein
VSGGAARDDIFKDGMKRNLQIIGIIAGLIIALITAGIGFLRGYFIRDICTGTGSLGYNFARVCGDGFLNHVGLFAIGSFALLAVLLALASWPKLKPIIRVVALGAFLIYAVWAALFSSSVWDTPYFMAYFYDPSRSGALDLNCLECGVSTPTP